MLARQARFCVFHIRPCHFALGNSYFSISSYACTCKNERKILLRTQCDLKWIKQNLQAEKVYWACLRLRVACHNLFTLFGSSLLFVNPCLVMIFRKFTTLSCSLQRVKALMWMSTKANRRYTRWNFKSLIYVNRSKNGINYAKCKSEVV